MVGMNPTNDKGEVVPIRAVQARKAAGMTCYEQDWIDLQTKMDDHGLPKAVRLNIPVRDLEALSGAPEILHRLANEIAAVISQSDLNDFTKLFETIHKVRGSEIRLRNLGK